MKSFFPLALALVGMALGATSLRAEDWKTVDGKTYQEVQVVKAEPDAVTILHHDGGARIVMENLPPDLQKARDAREARQAHEQAEQQLAQAQQMAQAAIDAQNTPGAPSAPATTAAEATPSANSGHASIGDLTASIHDLDDDACEPGHSSMESLVAASHSLESAPDSHHVSMFAIGGAL
jgi:type II secretory pathway pseudopilin PulG